MRVEILLRWAYCEDAPKETSFSFKAATCVAPLPGTEKAFF